MQAWHGFLIVCLVVGSAVGFYAYEARVRSAEIDSRLHEIITPILPTLTGFRGRNEGERPQGRRRPRGEFDEVAEQPVEQPESRHDALLAHFNNGPHYYIAWSRTGDVTARSTTAPSDIPRADREESKGGNLLRRRNEFRELIHFLPQGESVLVGTSMAKTEAQLTNLAFSLGTIGTLVIALNLTVGWWLANRALRPISQISRTAKKIAEGDLTKRIDVAETEGELGHLAKVLNNTFDRVEQSFEQQAQFSADASHELRTPLSVMLTQIQLALSRERTPEEYRQTLQTCERAAERMRTLVNQLLELARGDTGEVTVIHEECDLARVGREAIEFVEPLARTKNSKLKCSLEPVRARIDVMKIGQVLVNLLNNAIHHNEEGVEVKLSLKQNETHAIFRISDTGCGIPEHALPHLFDRFYRVDKARSRKKGSSGLGLAICKTIVEAHRGRISVKSKPGFGTQFTVELPLAEERN